MPLAIDTALAHPATEASLAGLQWLHERYEFGNILEIGCGNGILSLVSASIWDAQVLAGDISPKAVADTQAAIIQYDMQDSIKVVRSDGFDHPDIHAGAPYDLIICNLLADTHLRLANEVKNHSVKGGCLLLSGILSWRAADIETIYKGLGFEILEKSLNSPWQSYLFCNKTPT